MLIRSVPQGGTSLVKAEPPPEVQGVKTGRVVDKPLLPPGPWIVDYEVKSLQFV